MTPDGAGSTVLSVVGPGRSGTTVLANILGEVDGVVTAGEVRWLWRRGVVEQRPCGCGSALVECPVWSPVLAEVLGPPPYVHQGAPVGLLADLLAAQTEVASRRNRTRVIRSATTASEEWPALAQLRSVTADVCRALARTTGSQVVVDTSKRAQEAAVLSAAPGIDHYVLHIVRDPRAVAWSWGRAKPLRSGQGETTMATRTPTSSAGRWMENCVGAELLRRRVPRDRWLSVRYEDFVADPRGTVADVLAFVGVEAPTPFASRDTVVLGTHHTVAGNPDRFRTGEVRIASDDEWRSRMPARHQRAVAALTLPLLARYGYIGAERSAPRRSTLRAAE